MKSGPYLVCAFGKDKTGTVTGSVADGQSLFAVAGHSFLVGERLWISKSDDSGVQFLGDITAVDPGVDVRTEPSGAPTYQIGDPPVSWPTDEAKGSGAKVWTTPADQLVVFQSGAQDYSPNDSDGVAHHATIGGVPYAFSIVEGREFIDLGFTEAKGEDYAAFKVFKDAERRRGADPMTIAFWGYTDQTNIVWAAFYRLTTNSISFGPRSDLFGSFTLRFERLTDGAYVES